MISSQYDISILIQSTYIILLILAIKKELQPLRNMAFLYSAYLNYPSSLTISHSSQGSTVHLDRHFSLTPVNQSVATFTTADGL